MKQIRIEREKGYFGAIRALNIFIDGTHLGSLSQGETKVFEVQDMGVEIWGEMDWGKTSKLSLRDYDPGKTVVFKSYFSVNPLQSVGISNLPFRVFIR